MDSGEDPAGVHMARMTPGGRAGGIGVVWLWGAEEWLARHVDADVRRDDGAAGAWLATGALRRGWLLDAAGERVDEVVVAKPRDGFRMVTGHGGPAALEAVLGHFAAKGVRVAEAVPFPTPIAET